MQRIVYKPSEDVYVTFEQRSKRYGGIYRIKEDGKVVLETTSKLAALSGARIRAEARKE